MSASTARRRARRMVARVPTGCMTNPPSDRLIARDADTMLVVICMPLRAGHVRGSIVVGISACHAEDPGSIPGRGACGNPTRDRSFPRLAVSRLPSNCLTKLPAAGCLSAVLRLCLISVCAGLQFQQVRGSIVVSISACHAEDPGSIPGCGGMWHCPRVGWPSCRQLAQALFT